MFTSFTCKSAVCVCRTPGDRAREETGKIYRWQQKHITYTLLIVVTYLVQQPRLNFASYVTIAITENRPFPSSPGPLFQNEGRCSAFDMEIIFHSHANKTHFHKKGCVPSLILKVRVFGTRKRPIAQGCCLLACITSSEFITNT